MQLIKSTEKILKENLTLNVENHYFDDDIEGCDNKILEDNKLSTVVKFKDTSGKNRPVREDDLLLDKITIHTSFIFTRLMKLSAKVKYKSRRRQKQIIFSCLSWQRTAVNEAMMKYRY